MTKRPLWKLFFCLTVPIVAFLLGAIIVHYRLGPYRLVLESPWLARVSDRLNQRQSSVRALREPAQTMDALAEAFTDPLVEAEWQILPPIKGIEGISRSLESFKLDAGRFPEIYRRIELKDERYLKPYGDAKIVALDYLLDGPKTAFAGKISNRTSAASMRCAVVVIPGSGLNQEYEMLASRQDNYQKNILPISARHCDTFVLMRRNEFLIALHNGQGKLSQKFINYYLINTGGSYAASYLADVMALMKSLRRQYEKLGVAGLSQGGFAALLAARQAEPDFAIVASGYSVWLKQVYPAGLDQIAIPGLAAYYDPEALKAWMKGTPTKLLITLGRKEGGLYGRDALSGVTCNFFANLPNVVCAVHDGAHVFPDVQVEDYIAAHAAPFARSQ